MGFKAALKRTSSPLHRHILATVLGSLVTVGVVSIALKAESGSVVVDTLPTTGTPPGTPINRPPVIRPPQQPTLPGGPNSLPMVPVAHQREFRGVWVASVQNINWPSRSGLSVPQQKAELIQILDRMQELNLNALILQVRPASDALYASSYEPWSVWITGTQGQAPNPYYDPLEFAIQESHKRNIELHAWFNPYRARNQTPYRLAPNHVSVRYPQYAYPYGNLLWMDPGAREVQDWTYRVIMDVVRRYDVDGIHLDDYFYPYPSEGQVFPDNKTYATYRQTGGRLALADWRRDNVNRLVQRIASGIKAEKPYVKFGISPFGIYRPGQPPGITGLDQYNALYADAKKWLELGWVDYLAPQLYWRIDPPQQSYTALLEWWSNQNPMRRHLYAGNYLAKLDGRDWPVSEFTRQVAISRQKAAKQSLGNIFYSMQVFKENRLGVNNVFKTSLYPTEVLPPPMPWLDNQPPAPPTGVQLWGNQLRWSPASRDVRSWTLYRQAGASWQLAQVLDAGTTVINITPGTYALAAVDRLANESRGVVISVGMNR